MYKVRMAGNAECIRIIRGHVLAMADSGIKRGKGAGDNPCLSAMVPAGTRPLSALPSAGEPTRKPGAASKRGRPVTNAATTTSGQIMSVRVSRNELRAFDALIDLHGLRSRSDALRAMIRVASGFLEFSREDGAALTELQHELHKIGVNVNQIALAANRRQVPLMQAKWGALNELRAVLPSVRTLLKQMVDEHRRRGTALFRALVAEVDPHG